MTREEEKSSIYRHKGDDKDGREEDAMRKMPGKRLHVDYQQRRITTATKNWMWMRNGYAIPVARGLYICNHTHTKCPGSYTAELRDK